MKVNAKEAPEGYRAVRCPMYVGGVCRQCDFRSEPGFCAGEPCFPQHRKDRCNVIFKRVKKERKS